MGARWRIAVEVESRMIEEVVVGGHTVELRHATVPIGRVELDEDNPRIRYRLSLHDEGKSLEEVMRAMPEMKVLQRDIERNRGLRERVILQEKGSGMLKAVEGNSRLVCLRNLHTKYPTERRWAEVPARILPWDVDPRHVALLLADFHVAGKAQWKAHEKAGQVYYMHDALGMSQEDIAVYLRTNGTSVGRVLQAYSFMVNRFLKIDKGKYAKDGERKWSYFEEFFKQRALRTELKEHGDFGDDFCRWVGENRFAPADVRSLPSVLRNPEARTKLEEVTVPFSEVRKAVEAVEPEQGSEFFKLLAKVREACTNAAQVKEILRIRTDKVARKRLLDTYEALLDFMELADVHPEEADGNKSA